MEAIYKVAGWLALLEVLSTEPCIDDPGGPDFEELAAFSDPLNEQSEDNYYTKNWAKFSHHQWYTGFNWAAFFLGMYWCFFRKQYVLGLCVTAASYIYAFICGFAYAMITGTDDPTDPVFNLVAFSGALLVQVALSATANRFYLERAKSAIRAARDLPDRADQLRLIRKRGGTSWLGFSLSVILHLMIFAVLKLSAT